MSIDDDKLSRLYHEADTTGPSASLDDAILAAAHNAVDKPASARGAFPGSWPVALSVAAIIIITVILVPLVEIESPLQEISEQAAETAAPKEPAEEVADSLKSRAKMQHKPMVVPESTSVPVTQGSTGSSSESQSMATQRNKTSTAGKLSFKPDNPAPAATRLLEEMPASETATSAPLIIDMPEMWEKKIDRLLAEGRVEEARNEINSLKAHYPRHTISHSIMEKAGLAE